MFLCRAGSDALDRHDSGLPRGRTEVDLRSFMADRCYAELSECHGLRHVQALLPRQGLNHLLTRSSGLTALREQK